MITRFVREGLRRIRSRRNRTLIVQSGVFDADWYLSTNPDVAASGSDPLEHFMWTGAAEGRNPNPMFDTRWYLAMNADVAAAGWNPLVHYLRHGAAEGRQPHPLFELRQRLDPGPDQSGPNNPLSRYLRTRHNIPRGQASFRYDALARLRESSPIEFDALVARLRKAGMFDAELYRADAAVPATEDPFRHFLLRGEGEGRAPYARYAQPRVLASLAFRGVAIAHSAYAAFVEAQQVAFDARNADDRGAGRPTWVTPRELTVVAAKQHYSAVAEPSDRPDMQWPLSEASPFVVPFVAPDAAMQSIAVLIEGDGTGQAIRFAVGKMPDGLPVADGVAACKDGALVCGVEGRFFERSRRYFLRFSATGANGFQLRATEFYPIPLIARRVQSDAQTVPAAPAGDTTIVAKMAASTANLLRSEKPGAATAKDEFQSDTRKRHVAIVTILYRKADHVGPFLDAISRQNYDGPITVVFVDDGSPDEAFAEMERRIRQFAKQLPGGFTVKIVRNAENLGNCLSRNAGIASVNADIYVVIDADCLVNREFVSAHVAEHRLPGTGAVVGPYNIETNGLDGLRFLQQLESEPAQIPALATMQDDLLPQAFVNTVTRNFSISKHWLDAHGGFDPALSYSAKPDSGYGWEDVDIGARIYASGGRVRFTPHAFSIHMSHASSQPQTVQVRGSAKNFRHLVEKHGFLRTVSRRWYIDTADRIAEWADAVGASSPDIDVLAADIKETKPDIAPLLPYLRKKRARYRVLTHRWHVPHQCEIYKLPFDFTLVTGTGTGATNSWSYDQRPLPANARMVSIADVDPTQFDMAIVHFDENVLCPDLSNGILGTEWGDTFRWFTDHVKMPMVGVCHGTAPFVGQYGVNPDPIAEFELYEADTAALRERLAAITVVVNSHQAAAEWKFRKSRVIWHGYDPQEFQAGPHDLDIVTHGVDRARPHYRGAHALEAVLARLGPGIQVSTHKHVSNKPVPSDDPRYAGFAFQNWLEHLGRHKIYLNTTLRSPMPRSRTEAMLCGAIPVSLDNHDVSRFIQNGVNGFYASTPEELADMCLSICRNSALQATMSAAARATAIDIFNHDRFLTQWVKLVEETVG